MTNRDRIVKTLLCEAADRAPYGVGLGFLPWGETLARWRAESGIADLDLAAYFGHDAGFSNVPAVQGPYPLFEPVELGRDAEFVTSINERGITVRNRLDHSSMPEFIGHPLQTRDDWECYKAERLRLWLDERLASLENWAAEVEKKDMPRQFGSFPWGAFGTIRDLFGAEEVLLLFYDDPALVHDVMQTHFDLWLAMLEHIVRRIHIDHIHIWEDMSGKQGSLISMAMVEEFMMPCYDRVAAFARMHGIKIVSVDTDGKCDELVNVMHAHGINAMLPFEVQAGNDIEQFRRDYPGLGIIGGLDKNALAEGKAAIHRELTKAERMLAAGGYIPGCDHLIPPNVTWEAWKYFMHELKRIIGV